MPRLPPVMMTTRSVMMKSDYYSLDDHQLVYFGLAFAITAQAIRTEIDLVTFIIDPSQRVPVFIDSQMLKVFRITKPFEHSAFCNQRAKVDHALIAIVEDDLQDTMDDRLREHNTRQLL